MMKERITQHKRKVSESAQKLASLLDLNQKGRSSKGVGSDRHNTDDYEKINYLSEQLAKDNKVPIAWAYDVAYNDIVEPNQFLVIKNQVM